MKPRSNDTPKARSTLSTWILVSKYHGNKSNLRETADVNTVAGKVQDEPGISCGAREGKNMPKK